MGEEGTKEVLQASLLLSVLKHPHNGVTRGDEAARPEYVQAGGLRRPRQSDPPVFQLVNKLIDSIGHCRGAFEKCLTASDVDVQQSRLILRKHDFKKFISPLLRKGVDDLKRGVNVTVFNTEGKEFPMQFKIRDDKVNVLVDNWNAFVSNEQLKVSDVLKIWPFRNVRTEGLCFVIATP